MLKTAIAASVVVAAMSACSAITDLEGYSVSDKDPDGGSEDAQGDAQEVLCSQGLTLPVSTSWTLDFEDWSEAFRDKPVAVAVVGIPNSESQPRILANALFFNAVGDVPDTILPRVLPAGTNYEIVGFVDTNGTKGFQQNEDVSFAASICTDGRSTIPDPGTEQFPLGETIASRDILSRGTSFALTLDKLAGAHGGRVVEIAVTAANGAVPFYVRFDNYANGRDEPIPIVGLPVLRAQERYEARIYADVPGNVLGSFDVGDHRWRLSFLATALGPVFDPDTRITRDEAGIATFTHGSPYNELEEGDWPVTYE